MLESNPSADAGGMTEGQGLYGSASFPLPLLIPLKAVNSKHSINGAFSVGSSEDRLPLIQKQKPQILEIPP